MQKKYCDLLPCYIYGCMNSYLTSYRVQTVNLREEDIKLITDECEISKDAAEALLRNYNGNIEEALRAYISGQ